MKTGVIIGLKIINLTLGSGATKMAIDKILLIFFVVITNLFVVGLAIWELIQIHRHDEESQRLIHEWYKEEMKRLRDGDDSK